MASQERRGAPAVPLLQGLDDADMLEDEPGGLAPLDVVHAHPDEPVHLIDQLAGRRRHAFVAREVREGAVELAVVGEEAALLPLVTEAAEAIEIGQRRLGSVARAVGDGGGLQHRSQLEEIARVGHRDRCHAVPLPGSDRHQPLPFQTQERVPHRRLAHREPGRQVLLAQIGAGGKLAGEDLLAELPVDVHAQERSGSRHEGSASEVRRTG